MSNLTAEEITNLYLYKNKALPADRLSADLLRAATEKGTGSVDINDYINTGPGRFASPAGFKVVEKFFEPHFSLASLMLKPGTYTKDQLYAEFGLDDFASRGITVRQAYHDDGKDNHTERSYIWNTTAFKIGDEARFVIAADGTRSIQNFSVVPFSSLKDENGKDAENFDFSSSSFSSKVANNFLQPDVDPSGIGRTVDISFTGVKTTKAFSKADYLTAKAAKTGDSLMTGAGLAVEFPAFADRLFNSGSTRAVDSQGRPIIYGTNNNDASISGTAAKFEDLTEHRNLKNFVPNGIAYVTGAGSDKVSGTNGNDLFLGGTGNDTLRGGIGNDEYRYVSGDGNDIIEDSDGVGKITVDGTALTGSTKASFKDAASGGRQAWLTTDGKFKYVLMSGDLTTGATLQISGAGMGGGTLTVNNYKNDRLGLKLNPKAVVAFSTGSGNDNPITSADYASTNPSAEMAEYGSRLVKVFLNAPAAAGDTLRVSASGGASGGLQLTDGAQTRSLGSAVDLVLSAGQTEVVFALSGKDAISGDQTVGLNATLLRADGSAGATDTMTLTITDNGQAETGQIQTTRTINGDMQAADFDASTAGIQTRLDELDNVILSENPEPGRDDTLFDSAGNDLIQSGAGNDYILGLRGGDDVIDAGSGDDQADAGDGNDQLKGNTGRDVLRGQGGNDVLEGGAEGDILYGHAGDDIIYAEGKVVLADAMAQGATGEAGTGPGDFLNGIEGTDTLIGSNRNDLLAGGDGGDVIVAGQGDDFISGDRTYSASVKDWNVAVQVVGTTTTYTVNGASATDSEGGDDTIHAGAGNDGILAGGGNDFVMGETGDDKAWGDAGNDVMLGGEGADMLAGDNGIAQLEEAKHGDDFVDGGAGNDTLYGNGGNDALYGGAGDDALTGDDSAQTVAGDDFMDGEDGNDTMLGMSGDDVMMGGAGDDFIEGESGDTPLELHGDDQLFGEEGNDQMLGDGGADRLDGGADDDVLVGGAGQDELAGGDGNDYLVGGDGDGLDADADQLDGGTGDDQMFGEGGDDVMFGGEGADWLQGGAGNDTASGGEGADVLFGEDGDDLLEGDAGADQIIGGIGDDIIGGGADADLLFGDEGNDILAGDGGDDQLSGGTGDDILDGGDGSNALYGDGGNDVLRGGTGNDSFIGGAGNDVMAGGGGDDIYYYNMGDGIDRITDSGGTDWIVFGGGITLASITLDVGSLMLKFADGGSLHLDDFDPANPLEGAIEYIQFSDGMVMSRQQLIEALGFKLEGTPEADVLDGTALGDQIRAYGSDDEVNAGGGDDTVDLGAGDDFAFGGEGSDTIAGGDGSDEILGGSGNDLLDGGAGSDALSGHEGNDRLLGGLDDDRLAGGLGNDVLEGGGGDDVFQFGRGDGVDVAIDTLGTNGIDLTGGLVESEVRFNRQGQDLVIAVTGTSDQLTVKNWFDASGSGWKVAFSDGAVLDRAGVEERLVRNAAPVLLTDAATVSADSATPVTGNALANDIDPEGRALRVTSAGTWNGTYGKLTLGSDGAFSYILNTGSAALTALTAGQLVTDNFSYSATDDDPTGAASASSTIVVTVRGTNESPTVSTDWNSTYEDGLETLTGNVLENDADVDAATVLKVRDPGVYQGTYGSLTIAADGSYEYHMNNASSVVQALGGSQHAVERFNHTVTDGVVSVASVLEIGIYGQNDDPLIAIPLPDQSLTANTAYQWQIPAGSFTDVDQGDTLSIGVRLADGMDLPSWLSFDPATRTFSGRVPSDATGYIDVEVEVTDGQIGNGYEEGAGHVFDEFRLTFAASTGGNDGGGGGGGGNGGNGGAKGNEGVGNGEDPPAPGHDDNMNDGAGTSPGNPGAKGGTPSRQKAAVTIEPIKVVQKKLTTAAGHGKSETAENNRRDKGVALNPDVVPGNGKKVSKEVAGFTANADAEEVAAPEPIAAGTGASADANPVEPVRELRFGALANYLADKAGAGGSALTAVQIARRWDAVRNLSDRLAEDDENAKHGAQDGAIDGDGIAAGSLWGYAGSTGQGRSVGGMSSLAGLDEGFKKLN
ncbi:MAG TPA: VCBS domain-containing protein [Telluria sp.]